MRHESLEDRQPFDAVDIAAVWPSSAQVAPLPIPDLAETREPRPTIATAAAADVPAAVGIMIVVSFGMLLAALALATAGSGQSVFAIVIAAFFLFMFFAVPAVFLGVEAAERRGRSFDDFMERGMATLNGHCTGGAALVQMLLIPVSLTVGIVFMGIAAAIIF
jgi:hypothetical protein